LKERVVTLNFFVLCNKILMRFIRWVSGLIILVSLISLIFMAGSSLINTILILSFLVFIFDMVVEYKTYERK
jgi:hypothetical protein